MVERGAQELFLRGLPQRARNAEIEHVHVDVEVRHRPAHAHQERERHARLPERLRRLIDRLIGLELLGHDARQVALVDRAAAKARLEDVERLDVRVDDLLRELRREGRLRHLQVRRLHLEVDRTLGVGARHLGGGQRVSRDLQPQIALARERVLDRRRVRDADRPVVLRALVAVAGVVVERVAPAEVGDRIGHRSRDLDLPFGRLHGGLGDEKVEPAALEDADGVVERKQRGELGRRGHDLLRVVRGCVAHLRRRQTYAHRKPYDRSKAHRRPALSNSCTRRTRPGVHSHETLADDAKPSAADAPRITTGRLVSGRIVTIDNGSHPFLLRSLLRSPRRRAQHAGEPRRTDAPGQRTIVDGAPG